MNIQGLGLVWPSVDGSWIDTMGESGSNPSPGRDQPSASPSHSEDQTAQRPCILIIEDNSADVFLIRAAIKAANIDADIHIVKDGEQAIRFFDNVDNDDAAPYPGLVVLDINLPRISGGEVLQHMRKSRRCNKALVIAISSSDYPRDRQNMENLGVSAYFHKPSEYEGFMKLGLIIKERLRSEP